MTPIEDRLMKLGFFGNTSIDFAASRENLNRSVYEGTLSPMSAAMTVKAMETASKNNRMSPMDLGMAAASIASRGAVGFVGGKVIGKTVSGLAGTLGMLSPSQQKTTNTATGLLGAIGNILKGSM